MRGAGRLIGWCLALALVALPVVGVLRGWFAAGRWPVTQLTVQAEFEHITPQQIQAAVVPSLGKGFFALNLDQVQKSVAALPWVESVEASKRWPNTLLLRIYERQPFAYWNNTHLISRQGVVFTAPLVGVDPNMPHLNGPDSRLAEVVNFYAETQRAFSQQKLRVAGVSLTERGSWSLAVGDSAQIVLGDHDQAAFRLHRFLDIYPQLMAGHTTGFAYADLRYTNGFAVRWAPPAPATPAAGGTPRT